MSKNVVVGAVIVILILAGVYFFLGNGERGDVVERENIGNQEVAVEGASIVSPGAYAVVPEESQIKWSVGKPLIEGYINSGTISLKEGSITVATATATASFVIDMDSISVGSTPTKPGKESALETHLKSKDFFDVAKYPAGEFTITSVVPRADSNTTFMYDVSGALTMKGQSHEIQFPARIYQKDGSLAVEAEFTIDRTKWGITFGSGSFFANLADNAIEDTIHLTFNVVAR